jgi:hypothetical protein
MFFVVIKDVYRMNNNLLGIKSKHEDPDEDFDALLKKFIDNGFERDPQTWGNARFIGNLLERIYILHAKRCVREHPADKCQLRMLTPEDICQIEVPKPRPSIGFAISR